MEREGAGPEPSVKAASAGEYQARKAGNVQSKLAIATLHVSHVVVEIMHEQSQAPG